MQIVIDRIEDGKTAVCKIIDGGEMFIPVKQFPFKVHEGMWLDVEFNPNKKAEKNQRERIVKLQKELLKRKVKS